MCSLTVLIITITLKTSSYAWHLTDFLLCKNIFHWPQVTDLKSFWLGRERNVCAKVPSSHPYSETQFNSLGSLVPHTHTHKCIHAKLLRHAHTCMVACALTSCNSHIYPFRKPHILDIFKWTMYTVQGPKSHLDSSSSRRSRQRGVSVDAIWPNVPNTRSAAITSFMVTWGRYTNMDLHSTQQKCID